MGAVKHACLASLEDECWIPQETKLLRGRPITTPSQSVPPPVPIAAAPVSAAHQRGPSPAKLMMARSMLCMKTSALTARWPERSFRTVEGTVLTPGCVFWAEGGPYYEYCDERGMKAVESLAVTGYLKFVAHYRSSQGEWVEAQRSGRYVRLFITPLPPVAMVPGLVLAPYAIHDAYWQDGG
jgi:hypothetical protein